MTENLLRFYMREYVYDYYVAGIGDRRVAKWMNKILEKDLTNGKRI